MYDIDSKLVHVKVKLPSDLVKIQNLIHWQGFEMIYF